MKKPSFFCFLKLSVLTALIGGVNLGATADVIKGRVVDKDTGEPLQFVEVTVTEDYEIAKSHYNFTTDSLGRFVTINVGGNRTEVAFNLIGYYSHQKRMILLGTQKDTVNVGDVKLKMSDVMLRNAEVNSRARMFVVKGDTVVFNPQAFRLNKGARVNELLKQLPGVKVQDGKLEWMGKPIRLLMEGKELFSNAELFTQTLPAEAVERIKAYDKADDFEKRTGKKDGNEDYVLDLKIKPNFLEKWYGSASTTYQTKKDYLLQGDANFISTHNPMYVTANIGNTGSMILNRSYMSQSYRMGGFGRQQMGAGGYKHQWDGKQGEKTLENYVIFDAYIAHQDTWSENNTTREEFIPNTERTFALLKTRKWGHELLPKLNFNAKLNTDSLNALYFNAKAEWKKGRNYERRHEGIFVTDPYLLSKYPLEALFTHPDSLALLPFTTVRSFANDWNREREFHSSASATWVRQLAHRGMFSLQASYDYRQNRLVTDEMNRLDYFDADETDRYEKRWGFQPVYRHNFGLKANFKQWWSEAVMFKANYESGLNYSNEHRSLYDLHLLSAFDPTRPVPDDLLKSVLNRENSFRDKNKTFNHSLVIAPEMEFGRWRITPSLTVTRQREETDYERGKLDTVATRHAWMIRPEMGIRFAASKTSVWEASYDYQESLPELYSTLGYTDDTNPLYIVEGNRNLRRAAMHRANLSYRANLPKHQQSMLLNVHYRKAVRPLSEYVRYNRLTGVYRTKYINVRGGENWGIDFNYTQFVKERWELTNELELGYGTDYAYALQTELMAEPLLNRRKNYRISESPSVKYRDDAFNFKLGGKYTISHFDNTVLNNATERIMEYEGNFEAEYRWHQFTFGTDFTLKGYDGYTVAELNRLLPLWNLSASYKFLDNKADLILEYNDVLNKKSGYSGSMNATSRVETYQKLKHNYLSVTFIYQFDAK